MRIPHTALSPATLRAVVQEFVTRDGTDNSPIEPRIENVLRQLETGRVELHFDDKTETCNIVPVEAGGNPPTEDANGCRRS
ncbi:MAG: YheU family protein [Planctomycetia bacterium]|nr:YheU family protein [Planctomycetia bacterium]